MCEERAEIRSAQKYQNIGIRIDPSGRGGVSFRSRPRGSRVADVKIRVVYIPPDLPGESGEMM